VPSVAPSSGSSTRYLSMSRGGWSKPSRRCRDGGPRMSIAVRTRSPIGCARWASRSKCTSRKSTCLFHSPRRCRPAERRFEPSPPPRLSRCRAAAPRALVKLEANPKALRSYNRDVATLFGDTIKSVDEVKARLPAPSW